MLTSELGRKVPLVLLPFWVVKILTTAQGEALSDYLVHTIDPYLAVGLGLAGFGVALAIQLSLRRYNAWAYWFAVVMVAVFGTMAADAAHIELRIPYAMTASICALGLAAVFGLWYAIERTLSIHSIQTRRRELFYWAAVLATFAMGTALGDLTAYTFRWGFFVSGLVYTALFLLPFAARLALPVGEVFTFWFAYVLTRPLGASYADWIGVPRALGGLNWGRGTVSVALTLAIVALVAYLAVSRIDVERARPSVPAAALALLLVVMACSSGGPTGAATPSPTSRAPLAADHNAKLGNSRAAAELAAAEGRYLYSSVGFWELAVVTTPPAARAGDPTNLASLRQAAGSVRDVRIVMATEIGGALSKFRAGGTAHERQVVLDAARLGQTYFPNASRIEVQVYFGEDDFHGDGVLSGSQFNYQVRDAA